MSISSRQLDGLKYNKGNVSNRMKKNSGQHAYIPYIQDDKVIYKKAYLTNSGKVLVSDKYVKFTPDPNYKFDKLDKRILFVLDAQLKKFSAEANPEKLLVENADESTIKQVLHYVKKDCFEACLFSMLTSQELLNQFLNMCQYLNENFPENPEELQTLNDIAKNLENSENE